MPNKIERSKSGEKSDIDLIEKILPLPTSKMKPTLKRKKSVTNTKVPQRLAQTKKEPAMYIDFPVKPETPAKPETSEIIRPTKISVIIQLMGLLNSLLPNRELFYAVVKLIKVFISVAFTLSAIYASCIIYSNIFEWLFNFLTKGLKRSFEGALSYLPEILNSFVIQKALSFLPGVEAQPPINTYKYLPNFVYDMWLATKVLWSQPIFKLFLWALVGFVVLLNISRFIAYAATLPGSWAKKIRSAFSAYVQAFFRRCVNFLQFILELFRGLGKPGTSWLSLFWLFEDVKDKAVLNNVKRELKTAASQINSLSEINDLLDNLHEAKEGDNIFYNRHKIKSQVSVGFEYITQFKEKLADLHYWVTIINDRDLSNYYFAKLEIAEAQFKGLEIQFNHWAALFGELEFKKKQAKPENDSEDDKKNKSVFDSKDTKTRINPIFDSSPDDKNKTKPVPEDDNQKPKPALNPEDADLEETDDTKGKKL